MNAPVYSQQVNWWDVHTFAAPILAATDSWPMVGSQEWCELPDSDPRKISAVYDAAQHWALRVETCQQQRCAASHAIAAAADWVGIATKSFQRQQVYIPREVA